MEKLWVEIPIRAQKIANSLTDILLDGFYLAAFPKLNLPLHLVVLAAGFLSGWMHPGFKVVFSESLLFMILVGVLGIMSARLGFLFVVAFAIGDFFLGTHAAHFVTRDLLGSFWEINVPLIIEYALLWMLLVSIPLTVKELLGTLRFPMKINLTDKQVLIFAVAAEAVLTGLLVFLWSQAVPPFIRPVFTWNSAYIPISMAEPLQKQWLMLVIILSVAAMARVYIQSSVDLNENLAKKLAPLKEKLFKAEPVLSLTAQVPPVIMVIGSALWVVFFISGILTDWKQAVIIFVVFAVFSSLRNGLVTLPLGPLPKLMNQIPLIGRFIAGLLVVVWLANQMVQHRGSADGFQPLIVTIVLASAIFFLLTPPYFEEEKIIKT